MSTQQYKPGQTVPQSGLYKVNHGGTHPEHEVTAVKGEPFPPSREGHGITYTLVRAAHHLKEHHLLKN